MIGECVRMSLANILGNRVRSFLTVLGILIGVAAVIALITTVNGFSGSLSSSFSAMGAGTLTVTVTGSDLKSGLTTQDLSELTELEAVRGVTPSVALSARISRGGSYKTNISVSGKNAFYFQENQDAVTRGRALNFTDEDNTTFVCIISPDMVEEFFYGHQKGAFASAVSSSDGILEKANGGFLFLENVHKMPMEVQDMLAGVLAKGRYSRIGSTKERFVKFNIVSTSCVSPDEAVAEGIMSQEFRDYICEGKVLVPPLRDTRDDILPLAKFFIEQFDPKKRRLSREAREKLEAYQWPGNVRELVSVIRTAVARCHEDEIHAEYLNISKCDSRGCKSMAATERDIIIAALKRNGNNKSQAAEELGISRKTIYNKMAEYQIVLDGD